jgi:hypothetical protein
VASEPLASERKFRAVKDLPTRCAFADVLMANRQLRDDYLQSIHFNKLSIIINLTGSCRAGRSQENDTEKGVNEQLLPLVSCAPIVVGNDAAGELGSHLWFNIFLFSKALASRAPLLTTIRVVATEVAYRPIDCIEQNPICSDLGSCQDFFPSPYESLAGLLLCAHEEDCCHRGCKTVARDVVDMAGGRTGIAMAGSVFMCKRDARTAAWFYTGEEGFDAWFN